MRTAKRKPRRAELGLSVEQYDALLAAQGGGCAICGAAPQTERPRRAWRCRYCGARHIAHFYAAETCSCGKARPALRRLDVDHDHATGKVRGLLCARCNQALPSWVTPTWLRRAARYLGPGEPGIAIAQGILSESRPESEVAQLAAAYLG